MSETAKLATLLWSAAAPAADRFMPNVKISDDGLTVAGAIRKAADALDAKDARIAELEAALRDVWRPKLEWRNDCFGESRQALYVGSVCAGSIMVWDGNKNGKPWRGWFMNDEEGDGTGWFATADEARASVEQAARAALGMEPGR